MALHHQGDDGIASDHSVGEETVGQQSSTFTPYSYDSPADAVYGDAHVQPVFVNPLLLGIVLARALAPIARNIKVLAAEATASAAIIRAAANKVPEGTRLKHVLTQMAERAEQYAETAEYYAQRAHTTTADALDGKILPRPVGMVKLMKAHLQTVREMVAANAGAARSALEKVGESSLAPVRAGRDPALVQRDQAEKMARSKW